MAVTITHTQVRSVTAGALFSVEDTVSSAVNVSTSIFVYAVEGDVFHRVATAADLQTYPLTKLEAETATQAYYRQATLTRTFTELAAATNFGLLLDSRIKALCVEYAALLAGFTGSTTTVVSS